MLFAKTILPEIMRLEGTTINGSIMKQNGLNMGPPLPWHIEGLFFLRDKLIVASLQDSEAFCLPDKETV